MGGEASGSNLVVCEICTNDKTELFGIQNCSHSYCKECVISYVASKLQQNTITITCPVPNWNGSLEPTCCQSILPSEVFDRWSVALCEASVLESEKFYCPYKDCSAMLVDDGKEVVRELECPNCRRLFCAQCKVPWHAEIDCEEFRNLSEDEKEYEDTLLRVLAQEKEWIRCPACKFYVESSGGCSHTKCRCGYTFCYNCGKFLNSNGTCSSCEV